MQGDKSNEPNYYEVSADMKVLEGLLSALEGAICAIDVPPSGFTAPGVFLFELLKRVGVDSLEKAFMLVRKLDAAAELLAEDAADTGGRQAHHHRNGHAAGWLNLSWRTLLSKQEIQLGYITQIWWHDKDTVHRRFTGGCSRIHLGSPHLTHTSV